MTSKGVSTTEFWVHNVLQGGLVLQMWLGAINPMMATYLSVGIGAVYIVARAITKFGSENPSIIPPDVTDITTGGSENSVGRIPFRTSNSAKALLAICVMLLASSMAGCGLFATPTVATPQDQAVANVVRVEEAYLALTTPVDIAIASGSIKGKLATDIKVAEDVAISYIDAALSAAKSGTVVDVDTQLQLFQTARLKLIAAITAANGPTGSAPPSGQKPTVERMDALSVQIKRH